MILTALAVGAAVALGSCGQGALHGPEHVSTATVIEARALWLCLDLPAVQTKPFEQHADQDDPWVGTDKLMHFGVSFMVTLSTQYFLTHQMDLANERAWPVSAGTALAFGLFKELADSQRDRHPLFSWRDMTWNVAGVAVAVGVILL